MTEHRPPHVRPGGRTVAWFQCAAGASGDMLLGALLDAGASLELVRASVAAVGVEPIAVQPVTVRRAGLAALHAQVQVVDTAPSRSWADVRQLLAAADLPRDVVERACAAFSRLAEAEGRVHGIPADEVHFHEVGALDAIADVVGVCAAVTDLGIERVVVGEVALGSGRIVAEHGVLPVPPPAVLALFAGTEAVVAAGPVPSEACTPTGAALLTSLADAWGPLPRMRVRAVGVGAGTRDAPAVANVIRVVLGEETR